MWSILQVILDFVSNNADIIAGVLAAVLGIRAGIFTWAFKTITQRLIVLLAKYGKKEAQKPIDNGIIKEGDKLEKEPLTEVEKQRQENLLDLINGGKK